MTTKLHTPSKTEEELIKNIRNAVNKKIEYYSWSDIVIAEKLGLAECGANMFLRRCSWTVEEALRTAEALDINIVMEIVW